MAESEETRKKATHNDRARNAKFVCSLASVRASMNGYNNDFNRKKSEQKQQK